MKLTKEGDGRKLGHFLLCGEIQNKEMDNKVDRWGGIIDLQTKEYIKSIFHLIHISKRVEILPYNLIYPEDRKESGASAVCYLDWSGERNINITFFSVGTIIVSYTRDKNSSPFTLLYCTRDEFYTFAQILSILQKFLSWQDII
jgi:hypothetical protein